MKRFAALLLSLLVIAATGGCGSHPTISGEDDWGTRTQRVIDEVDEAIERQNELYEKWGTTPEEIHRRLNE